MIMISKKAVKDIEKVIREESALFREALNLNVNVRSIDGLSYIAEILSAIEEQLITCIENNGEGLPELLKLVQEYKKEAEIE